MALRAEGRASKLGHAAELATSDAATPMEQLTTADNQGARTRSSVGGGIAVAVHDHDNVVGKWRLIERLATVAADQWDVPALDRVTEQLGELVSVGFDRLLAEHRTAWARRWATARVDIEGCPGDELAARFAVFHLLASALGDGEVAVGARGLSGPAYGGHVFWDADVFVLPALAAIHPAAARAMLEYRIRRLPAARQAAQESGFAGARFPWESATTGRDVTPRQFVGKSGDVVVIRTGELEEHIVADVAWAASEYAAWTGDTAFLRGPGADLVLDTARYWASRVTIEPDGRGHVRGVIGPDEYHEVVDDNAFTNVMARWNLRRGADLADELGRGDEAARWRQLASKLVDGWDADRRLYEQFAGYWALEPLLVDQVADPPFAADVLLGAARVRGSQLIKQADVVLLHHLVPGEVEDGSLKTNLAFYEPRTVHGSSLSPAIHAALLARAGEPDRALVPFRIAARLDLDDLTGTTAGGLHLATMGGLWQALAYGFCGLRPVGDVLHIDPRLPSEWSALAMNLVFRGDPVVIRAEHDRVVIDCTAPLTVRIGASRSTNVPAAGPDIHHRRRTPAGTEDTMNTLLAALDTSPNAAAVLDTALRLGKLTGDTVESVHVRDGPTESLEWLAAQAGVNLRLLEGPVDASLLAAVEDPGVDAAVLGARATTGGRRALGSHAPPRARADRQAGRCRTTRRETRRPAISSSARAARRQRALIRSDHRHPLSTRRRRRRTRRAARLHRGNRAAGTRPPEPRPGDVGQRIPRPALPQRLADRAAHRIDRLTRQRRMPGRTRRPHRAQLVTGQLARTGDSHTRRTRPLDSPRPAHPGQNRRSPYMTSSLHRTGDVWTTS